MRYLAGKTILIISPERWGHLPVSKHHYARTLAVNNNVYFLNPPGERDGLTISDQDPNLRVVDYKTFRGINRMPSVIRDQINKRLIKRIQRLTAEVFDVIWSFDSFRFQNLNLWNAETKIYHVVDVHSAPLEQELLETADLILSVSQMIQERSAAFKKPKAKINHGLASSFLEPAKALRDEQYKMIRHNGRVRAGYVGNLDNWCLDQPTLLRIVIENSETDFYFIGPHKEGSQLARNLSKFENAVLVGRVESNELPAWFQHMQMFLMCYDGADAIVNSNHHKILEFLSTGKPAVINYTDEYKDKRALVVMADSNEQLPELFRKVSQDPASYTTEELVASRRRYAAENSYQSQLERIDCLLESMNRS